MVAYFAKFLTAGNVLDVNPEFLIEQEYEHIVEERDILRFAFMVISTTCYYQALVDRQIAHRMPCSSTWSDALLSQGNEICSHDFVALDGVQLEKAKFVLQLTFCIFTAKEVDPILNCITESLCDGFRTRNYRFPLCLDTATCALYER